MNRAAILPILLLAAPVAVGAEDGVKQSASGGVGSQPAAIPEILDGVADCVAAVHQHGKVEFDKLKAGGWQFAGKQEGKQLGIPMTQLYLGKGNVIELIQMTGISAACQTIAKVSDSTAAESELRSGLTQRFGAVAAADYKGDTGFKATVEKLTPGSLARTLINDTNRFAVVVTKKNDISIVNITMTPKITD